MSDHIVSTAMPHALHPNCYLDVLFSEDENEILGGSSFTSVLGLRVDSEHIDLLSEVLRKTKPAYFSPAQFNTTKIRNRANEAQS